MWIHRLSLFFICIRAIDFLPKYLLDFLIEAKDGHVVHQIFNRIHIVNQQVIKQLMVKFDHRDIVAWTVRIVRALYYELIIEFSRICLEADKGLDGFLLRVAPEDYFESCLLLGFVE